MSYSAELLSSHSLEQATELLAKRAAVARLLREKISSDKQADAVQDALSNLNPAVTDGLSALQRQIQMSPALASTLGGAAVGAGVGGLSSLFAPKEKRQTGRSMVTGAIGGAGLGAGAYLGSRMIPELNKHLRQDPSDLQFKLPGAGLHKIDKELVSSNPSVIGEIDKLKDKSLLSKAVGATTDAVNSYGKNHPVLATLLGLDAASHTAGTVGGIVSGMPGTNAKTFRAGLESLAASGDESYKRLNDYFKQLTDSDIVSYLDEARARGRGFVDDIVLNPSQDAVNTARANAKSDQAARSLRAALKRVSDGLDPNISDDASIMKRIEELASTYADKIQKGIDSGAANDTTRLTLEELNKIYNKGTPGGVGIRSGIADAFQGIRDIFDAAKNRFNPFSSGGTPKSRTMYTGKATVNPANFSERVQSVVRRAGNSGIKPTTLLGHLGPRAALYAGVPLLQEYSRIASKETADQAKLRQIVEQLSKPVN